MKSVKVSHASSSANRLKTRNGMQQGPCRKYQKKDPDLGTSADPGEAGVSEVHEEQQQSWTLISSFTVRPPVSLPFLMGCVLDDRIMIRDLWSDELYMTNIQDGVTKEAFVKQLKGDVFYCATLGDDRMVYCDSKSGLVHVCTTRGQHIKTIAITHRPSTHMYHITVDSDGHVVFGVRDGKIFIIDPQEGKIVSSFGVECKIEAILVTPSGHIVIKSGIAKFNVIRDGVVIHTITEEDWSWAACVAHPTKDILYIAYSKTDDRSRRSMRAMRPTGEVLEDDVFQLVEAPHHLMQPSMTITDDCQIVLCDNGKLLTYQKNRDQTSCDA